MSVGELFQTGGFIMYPLLLCSIAVWAVAIEKWFFLARLKKEVDILQANATELIMGQRLHEAKGLGMSVHPVIRGSYEVLFEKKNLEGRAFQDRLERRLRESQHMTKKMLWLMGTIGSSSPFIGLFGTVVGIIKAFESMAQSGQGGFSVVAGGLSEALIATAAGILVAVVSVFLYNFYSVKINSFNLYLKSRMEDLGDLFS